MSENSEALSRLLINWYNKNARPLPWRNTTDPYKIWVSEIILQQTTVQQGRAYYESFLSTFPTVEDLAKADASDVMKAWEGLGYYSRARNLHASAKNIALKLDGQLPNNYNDLLKLKGIGPYTAAAIASFAFHQPHVVVDGNVLRLFSRLFGISKDISRASTKQKIWGIGQNMILQQKPYVFNQAIMEFGALVCTPKSPGCSTCALRSHCHAFIHNQVGLLPAKAKKKKKKKRYFHYTVIVTNNNKTFIRERAEKDIWRGLYEFPLQEVDEDCFDQYVLPLDLKVNIKQDTGFSKVYKQELTHQTIYSRFYKHIDKKGVFLQKLSNYKKVDFKDLNNYAFPKTTCLFLVDNSITLV